MPRVITVVIELQSPTDSMFTLGELREMIEATLQEWDFDGKRVVGITEEETTDDN